MNALDAVMDAWSIFVLSFPTSKHVDTRTVTIPVYGMSNPDYIDLIQRSVVDWWVDLEAIEVLPERQRMPHVLRELFRSAARSGEGDMLLIRSRPDVSLDRKTVFFRFGVAP